MFLTHERLDRLSYLNAVVKEVMRCFPRTSLFFFFLNLGLGCKGEKNMLTWDGHLIFFLFFFLAVPVTYRVAPQNLSLCGYFVPKGTVMAVAPVCMQRLQREWGSTASTFLPDRWLAPPSPPSTPAPPLSDSTPSSPSMTSSPSPMSSSSASSSPSAALKEKLAAAGEKAGIMMDHDAGSGAALATSLAYIPFLAGPRRCIGARFALAEIKTVLATLLVEFELELAPKADGSKHTDEEVMFWGHKIQITMKPDPDIKVILRRRGQSSL
jgi:cytochrome P450